MRITLAVLFGIRDIIFTQNPDFTWVQTYTWEAKTTATACDKWGAAGSFPSQ